MRHPSLREQLQEEFGKLLQMKKDRKSSISKEELTKRENLHEWLGKLAGVNKPRNAKSQTKPEQPATRPEKPKEPKPKITLPYVELEGSESPKVNRLTPVHYSLLNVPLETRTEIYEGDPEQTIDTYIGLDFGTSSVKAALFLKDEGTIFAVPFMNAPNIHEYLLPTLLYQKDNGDLSIEEVEGKCISGIKAALIDNPSSITNQVYAIAYLSIVLKRIRGWFFKVHEDDVKKTDLVWHLIIGVPSVTAKRGKAEVWEKIARLSWELSLSSEIPNVEAVREMYYKTNPNTIEVKAKPELSALIYAITSNAPLDNGCPYALVDIGASTVDAAAFWFTRGSRQFEYTTTIVRAEVRRFGTQKCHESRISGWAEAITNTIKEKQINELVKLKNELSSFELTTEMNLPHSYKDYVTGAKIICEEGKDLDNKARVVASTSAGQSILAFGNQPLTGKKVSVYLTGGGSSCKAYQEGIDWVKVDRKDRAEVRDSVKELKELIFADDNQVGDDAWIRLSTAYGLAKAELGEVVIEVDGSSQGQAQNTVFDDSYFGDVALKTTDYTDNFISKDQV